MLKKKKRKLKTEQLEILEYLLAKKKKNLIINPKE